MNEIRDAESLFSAVALFAGGTASLAYAVSKAALPVSAAQLVRIANELGRVADNYGINKTALLSAAEQLSHADDDARPEAVSRLIRESVTLAHDAVNMGRDDLMRSAIDLALAGRCILRVAALGRKEGSVAGQPNPELKEQQVATGGSWRGRIAAWWSKWRGKTRKRGDLEEYLLQEISLAGADSAAATSSQSKGS